MYLFIFLIWILLNGQITLEICLLGIGVTALIGIIAYALFHHTPKEDFQFVRRIPIFIVYLLFLILEIFKANFSVISIILNKEKLVHPTIVVFHSKLKSKFARYVLANSITLTPGTITVKTEQDNFTVHCLDKSMIEGITEGRLYRLLEKMERD